MIHGDCRTALLDLPSESVHCCVTSPPYYGLRDYGTAKWEGGDSSCSHTPSQDWIDHNFNAKSAFGNGAATQSAAAISRWYKPNGECRCGAVRLDAQIGLEDTPDAYVAEMVAVFREVRRVLRSDGTLWLNIGDSYANGGSGGYSEKSTLAGFTNPNTKGRVMNAAPMSRRVQSLKPKDLIGIPWMLAFALRADGWWLRQDIIWSKPNPMPESVTDRCTKAHEYLFLLSKSATYRYDAGAIAEPQSSAGNGGFTNKATLKSIRYGASHAPSLTDAVNDGLRNKRSVWEVSTNPYSEAHFATFPPALIEPCILAGCPKGGTVLDPFGGAGTTGLVADRLERSAVLIELNPAYATMARNRITDDAPLFAEVS